VPSTASGPPSFSGQKFVPIGDLAWDQGGYGSATLTIYIDLPGVGGIPRDRITCHFTKHGIDLTVLDLEGKNYRYVNANLEKDIVVESSKMIVKSNKIVLKLAKVKGQYSYDTWQQLTAKKPRDEQEEKSKSKDPSSSIMNMMKDLYEDGDENMKKIIGEAMEKSQRGEKMAPGSAGGDGLDF
jgi:calcyclin binding protein